MIADFLQTCVPIKEVLVCLIKYIYYTIAFSFYFFTVKYTFYLELNTSVIL